VTQLLKISFALIVLFVLQQNSLDAQHSFPPPVNVEYRSGTLPLLIVDTENQQLKDKSQDERIAVQLKLIEPSDNGTVTPQDTLFAFNGYAGLKYRGSSSFSSSPKKPYSLELWRQWYAADSLAADTAVSLLGMPAASDWVLLAPFNDKSYLRDALVMELMQGTQDFIPKMRFCELIFNGKYYGLYILAEKIERGKNRLDIASAKNKAGRPQECGYHLEIDRTSDPGFNSTRDIRNLLGNRESWREKVYYQYKYPKPEDITDEQLNFIRQRIDSFELIMERADFNDSIRGYPFFIDPHSVMGYMLAQELTRNVDGYRLSTHLYKDADSKDRRFKLSIWDFNISFGNADYGWAWSTEGWSYNQAAFAAPFWFKQILRNPGFLAKLRQNWKQLRNNQLSDRRIISVLDSLQQLTADAAFRNNQAWQMVGRTVWPVFYMAQDYIDELTHLRNWMQTRVNWLDDQWLGQTRNHIANGSFDCDGIIGVNAGQKISVSQWPTLGGQPLHEQNKASGRYAYEVKSRQTATQIVTEIDPGIYTLRVKVKTYLTPDAYIYVKNHGRSEQKINIPNVEGDFRTIELRNIEVSNPHCEVGIAAWYAAPNSAARVWYDDVELFKQEIPNGLYPAFEQPIVSIAKEGILVEGIKDVYNFRILDASGRLMSSGKAMPGEILPIVNHSPGIYVISIVQGTGITNRKIIIR